MQEHSSPNVPVRRIHELIAPWAFGSQSNRLAVRDPKYSLTYGELAARADELAARLQRLGLRGGDRLMVVGENCVVVAALLLAASKLDVWLCVVNSRLSPREIDDIRAHARPRRVIYTAEVSSDARAHGERHEASPDSWPSVGEVLIGPEDAAADVEPVSPNADQVAVLIYTSGTSGSPKGVMLTHANVAFVAQSAKEMRSIVPGDVTYGVLPMAHVVGLSTQLMGGLAGGATILLEPRFSPEAAATALESAGVTLFVGVPALFARLMDWSRERGRSIQAPRLKFAGVAGSPLTQPLKDAVEAAIGQPLNNGYGLTESGPTVAQTRVDAPRSDCSVGQPIPGVEVRIVDTRAMEVAVGETGELWVRGPGVMRGYFRNPELTREVVNPEGWFNTGDMARQDADGALHIVGRTKELIIRSGFNVYPVEVEQAINSHPQVVQSAVVGRQAGHNEEVVAFVELRDGATLTDQDLAQYLRSQLSPYKQPTEIRFMKQMPAAPTGKVLKSKLKELAAQAAVAQSV